VVVVQPILKHTVFKYADSGRFALPKKLAAISFPIHFTGVHLAHLRSCV
jgi:hypothetical protein